MIYDQRFFRLFLNLSASRIRFLDDSFRYENVLFLKRKRYQVTPKWSERWPDGLRESLATHLLIKFYVSEMDGDFFQIQGYRHSYQYALKLTEPEVQLFVISVQTPRAQIREELGYLEQRQPGVYYSNVSPLSEIPLISLNELSPEPHNAPLKCFASEREERLKAYEVLERDCPQLISGSLKSLLLGLPKVDLD